jgi:ubiquinone/menaquinone biosynthesis C-methylase UbiE
MSISNGFTKNADLYRTSPDHAESQDLELASDALGSVAGLAGLDVATGTGHTAFFFAKKQAHMFAIDTNEEMLRVAQEESDRETLSVRFLKCPAENMIFDDDNFDFVACRLAPHHFDSISKFLAETARVLRPGGQLLIIDNVVPPDQETGIWINEYERSRDPSHHRCLTVHQWEELLQNQNLQLAFSEPYKKKLQYDPWMLRMSHDDESRDVLWQRLLHAPKAVRKYLKPKVESKPCQESGTDKEERVLTLHRQIMIARKKS